MERRKEIDALLKSELTLALGCTEPACAALTGARVKDELGETPKRANVKVSRDMMKNAMGVSIPNSNLTGISAAVALGLAVGNSSRGLSVLEGLDDEKRAEAKGIDIEVEIESGCPSLFIEVSAKTEDHSALCTIENEHDRFSRVIKDGKDLLDESKALLLKGAHRVDVHRRVYLVEQFLFHRRQQVEDVVVVQIKGGAVDVRQVHQFLHRYLAGAILLHALRPRPPYLPAGAPDTPVPRLVHGLSPFCPQGQL